MATKLSCLFIESAFWKGCGGTFFAEKGSPAIILKIILYLQLSSNTCGT